MSAQGLAFETDDNGTGLIGKVDITGYAAGRED
jgi:hypothetical protein